MSTPRILIVDDIADNIKLAMSVLQTKGYDFSFATGGARALEILQEEEFDLLLLDVMMPEIDGFEVCRRIKADERLKEMPVIFLTAKTDADSIAKGFEAGAVDYVTKPFNPAELLARVKNHIELFRAKKMLRHHNLKLATEVKDAAGELRRKDELLIRQSKMAAMGEMLGVIAHQWKQPLNALSLITSNLEMMFEMGKADKAFVDRSVEKTMRQIAYMTDTIEGFRNFFDPNKHKMQFEVKEAVRKALDILGPQIAKAGMTVAVTGEELNLRSCETELEQVVINIVNNAKDAFVENNVTERKMEIRTAKEGTENVLYICDNAGGIPDAIKESIFEPYFTTKGEQGTGIGLYMVKLIVENSFGGDITVERAGDGSCFRIVLSADDQD